MSRKDYELLAAAINENWRLAAVLSDPAEAGARLRALDLVAQSLAEVLAADNPRFDRNRFLVAAFDMGARED